MNQERRLAAILVADVVGYSKLVGSDETGTLSKLSALRRDLIEPAIAKHAGRLFKAMGDGFLVEFASAVQAVEAARAIQQANTDGELALRIGIHVGDVVVLGDDLMGDGINIAARIEGVAEPGGIAISREVHAQVRDKLDIGFDDKGEIELKNLTRPVHVFSIAGSKPTAATASVLALPDKPSIAVLPFQNMSGDPEQEYFADGMTEDVITELTRFHSLFVIARNSSFSYKGKSPDVRDVGRELGVRYVLEGSVRKAGDRIRLTGQLIDTQAGTHIWAERYDRLLDDIFVVQEELTRNIVAAIAPHISEAEVARVRRRKPDNLSAYEISIRASAAAWDAFTRSDPKTCDESLRLASSALALDPDSIVALGARAMALHQHVVRRTAIDRDSAWREGVAAVERMLEIDRSSSVAHVWKGMFLVQAPGDRFDDSLMSARRGHDLNPHDMPSLMFLAYVETTAGNPERAIELAQEALRLSPLGPLRPHVRQQLTIASFHARRYAEGIEHARHGITEAPELPPLHAFLAANCVALGQIDQARSAIADARRTGRQFVDRLLSGEIRGRDRDAVLRLSTFLRVAAGLEDASVVAALR